MIHFAEAKNYTLCWVHNGYTLSRPKMIHFAKPKNDTLCWDQKWYTLLRPKMIHFAEPKNDTLCWVQKLYTLLRPKMIHFFEPKNDTLCWAQKWYTLLRQKWVGCIFHASGPSNSGSKRPIWAVRAPARRSGPCRPKNNYVAVGHHGTMNDEWLTSGGLTIPIFGLGRSHWCKIEMLVQ